MPKICEQPFNTCNIQSNGEVYSCLCHRWMPICIGNIFDKDFFKVWHSNKIKSIRQDINSNDFSKCNANECPNLYNLPKKNKDLIASPLPQKIMLTLDQSCNLACPSCRLGPIVEKKNKNVRRILDHVFSFYNQYDIPVEIFCDGFGDIFASKSYLEFFHDVKLSPNVMLNLTTNGTTIHLYRDLIFKLKPNIMSFIISLDAGKSKTYSSIRKSSFEQVCENSIWLSKNGYKVHSQLVLQKKNQNEIIDYYRLSKQIGCHTISMQLLDRWNHHTDNWWNENKVQMNDTLNNDLKYLLDNHVQMCGGIMSLMNTKHHNLPEY